MKSGWHACGVLTPHDQKTITFESELDDATGANLVLSPVSAPRPAKADPDCDKA